MDYKDGFTFVHVAEELVGVSYRYHKNYSGFSIYEKKNMDDGYQRLIGIRLLIMF